MRKVRAWAVHLYTSLGLLAALLALIAVVDGRPQAVFMYLGLALVIDATDGPMARRFDVLRWAPGFDGRKLDDITDYLTYVFIPVFFIYRFELVTGPWVMVLGLVLLASGFGFCKSTAKTEDHSFFTGFPSYWNIVAFYFYLFRGDIRMNGLILLVLAILVFVPIKYITAQTRFLRPITNVLQIAWFALFWVLVITIQRPLPALVWLSLLYPAYHLALSFYLQTRDIVDRRRLAAG